MSVPNRSAGRDVHIYDATDPRYLEIICIFDSTYILRDEYGTTIQRDDSPLHSGKYYILTAGSITHNDEPWLVRTISAASGTRVAAFRDAVHSRDRRCIITGRRRLALIMDSGGANAYSRWITVPATSGGSINSIQNGILLESGIHQLFDGYDISINPDDNYKIVCSRPNGKGVAGKRLDKRFLEDPLRPVDQLLRWHFRQAVFAIVRGAGEPIFECDFSPGSDMIREIIGGPRAGELMGFELFSRLAVGDREKATST
ncbi:MAG: hypothetical protein M1839_006301 [Geoglossum umbratile]|nr:MAG: hypothetical protein M1839_006301 [Geoglossum umbratile]